MSTPRDNDVERALKIVGMILGIIVTAGTIGAAVARAVVAPVASDLAVHKAQQAELPDVLKQMNKKLDALCRAHPAAQCPLGERE